MLKIKRVGLPPDIENNSADWQKIVSATDYELTQVRAKFKKEVRGSNIIASYVYSGNF
jgi:hypothetical protein